MKRSMIFLALIAANCALADEPKQPRTLGNTAVLHVYYYAPKTLEVTYVDSYLFKDESSCKEAIPKALLIAAPHAGEGDLVSASCVGVTPPGAIIARKKPTPDGSTEL